MARKCAFDTDACVLVLAAARAVGAALVTREATLTDVGLVETIWSEVSGLPRHRAGAG